MECFGDIEAYFLRNNTNLGPSVRPKLLAFFDNDNRIASA